MSGVNPRLPRTELIVKVAELRKGDMIMVPMRTNVFKTWKDEDGVLKEFPKVDDSFWEHPALVISVFPQKTGAWLKVLWRCQVNIIDTSGEAEVLQRVQNYI